MTISRNISFIIVALVALIFTSYAHGQTSLLQQRIQDAKAFEAEQERERQADQRAINELQDQIDNINANPNRTQAENQRAGELQDQIFDQQDGFRRNLDRFLTQPRTGSGPEPRKPNCGPQDNGSYILCEPIPLISPIQKDPAALLRQLYILALILAGSVAFIQIVRGGILYSISGVVDGKNRAKSIFKGVAQGLALLMGSYVILNTINPALVTLRFPDADNYFPPVPQQRETIYDEMEQMRTDFENDGRLLTRETQSQVADLEYRQANINDTQEEIDRLSSIPNRTDDEESQLRFARENLARDKRSLQIAEEEVLLLESSNPAQLSSQQISRKERTIRFMEINLTDTKDTINELSSLRTRTPSQQRELDLSIELLPQYQKEFDAAQSELMKLKR